VTLSDLDAPRAVTLIGTVTGGLGSGGGTGRLTLEPDGAGGTRIAYVYEAAVGGKVAAVGGRLLDGAARVIIGGFFTALARRAGGPSARTPRLPAVLRRLLDYFGVSA
jgi:2-furoyl-CoA dehydrogenase large subunit